MGDFSSILLSTLGLAIFLLPVCLVLILVTFVTNLFSGFFKPIAEPIRGALETVSGLVSNPLERIPLFPKIKRCLGSTKNILFICFVMIYLLFHYRSLRDVDIVLNNISLLFPGSALDLVTSFLMSGGNLDMSSFLVNPENYLQTIIFSLITGLFLHIGCTTKAADAKIHFLVKLFYTVVITLFSSVVLGKLPSDIFAITFPDISFELTSVGTFTGSTDAMTLLTTLQQWGGILLQKMVGLLPVVVAFYFLCKSISGFAAAALGGLMALFALSVTCPEVIIDPNSFGAAFLLLFAISAAEFVALFFSEYIDTIVSRLVSKMDKVFDYYNIVSLLLSYWFYPTLVLPVLAYPSVFDHGFHFDVLLICIACLLVFAMVTFVGYKLQKWVWKREHRVDGVKYAAAMVINIPIWIIYLLLFKI